MTTPTPMDVKLGIELNVPWNTFPKFPSNSCVCGLSEILAILPSHDVDGTFDFFIYQPWVKYVFLYAQPTSIESLLRFLSLQLVFFCRLHFVYGLYLRTQEFNFCTFYRLFVVFHSSESCQYRVDYFFENLICNFIGHIFVQESIINQPIYLFIVIK